MIGGDLLCVRAPRVCDSIGGNRLCVRSPACVCVHLTVTVKIRTLGSNVAVALASSLVWWDSP